MLLVESKVQMPVGPTLAGRHVRPDPQAPDAPGNQLSNVDSRPTGRKPAPNRMLSAEPNPVACLIPVDTPEVDAGDGHNPAARQVPVDAHQSVACGGPTSGGPR